MAESPQPRSQSQLQPPGQPHPLSQVRQEMQLQQHRPKPSMARLRPALAVDGSVYDVGPFPNIDSTLAHDPRLDTVVALCTPCHSARYILAQPPLSKELWQAEITKMIEGFGATVPEDTRDAIADYLTDHYGPNRIIPPTTGFPDASPAAPAGPGNSEALAGSPGGPPAPLPGNSPYRAYCIACHGADGRGVPGAFPPLAGHADALGQSPAGRDYLVDVVLHGLAGSLQIGGAMFNNMMPPLEGRLTDAEIAAALNDIRAAWPMPGGSAGPGHVITPAEVSGRRAQTKSPQQVYQTRPPDTY